VYSDHSVENGVLLIPVVRDEDFGVYVCSARNKLGFVEATTELVAGGPLLGHIARTRRRVDAACCYADVAWSLCVCVCVCVCACSVQRVSVFLSV